ncbi:MAG: formylglycine-generating enzyme family protein [Xanthomonadales bacterium]|nr:formylglycine-generating enzyme family protein [Xanthomonadales bacterium]
MLILLVSSLPAQEVNLGDEQEVISVTESAETQDNTTNDRRVKRLGDVVGENEFELELSVPKAPGQLAADIRLPDERLQQQLQDLLTQLANNSGDASTQRRLSTLLDQVIANTNEAIDRNDRISAEAMLAVVDAVNPNQAGLASARQRLADLDKVDGQLTAARKAMQENRIDQPENSCAWYFYRQVLDSAPENIEAQEGLISVQEFIISRALEQAKVRDFDSAERSLEDAELVWQDQTWVEQARQQVEQIKKERAGTLEESAVRAMDAGQFEAAERFLIDLVALGGQDERVNALRRRLEEARVYGGFKPGQIIRDHFMKAGTWAPESVVVLAGSFMMGSTEFDQGRVENEIPQHRVTFRRGFAIGQREVSVEEFRVFVHATGYRTDAQRFKTSTVYDQYSGRLMEKSAVHWEMDYEGKPASPKDPVIHVSWNDANAYVDWLAQGTGKSYRLPSEAEFEYALRGGTNTKYWWGNGSPSQVVENLTGDGDSSRGRRQWSVAFPNYSDKFWGPAPVASFKPNPYGLYDMGGNVGEWVRDCWHDSYVRAPLDGSAWINPGCNDRVLRGGYWASSPENTRAPYRLYAKPDYRDSRTGFRIARDL